ncbi:MAG: Lrp/AsnC family transcriptional regulator [Candidatus Thermoplasmatota archaeon]|nr:Lrp/AsnC family transcriptional regulator [Candidatus Thermoplasmatota archaeon]
MGLNKKDKKIVEVIQKDARTPISNIARKVGLSENGVRYRLEKLEETGYIRSYIALLNPRKFGKKHTVLFHIKTRVKNTKNTIKELCLMEELNCIYQTTGQYTIFAIGLFKDMGEINNFVNAKLSGLDMVEYSMDIVTKKAKESPFFV